MRCPGEIKLMEDWQRSQRGEAMLFAAHIAECPMCLREMRMLREGKAALSQADRPSQEGHVAPEGLALYAEGKAESGAIMAIEAHLSECSDCRTTVSELTRLLSTPARSAASLWVTILRSSAMVVAGAALTMAFVSVMPGIGPTGPSDGHTVTVSGYKGQGADPVSALKAIDPSDDDLGFAIAVWQKALEDKPDDELAKKKLAELKLRLRKLEEGKRKPGR